MAFEGLSSRLQEITRKIRGKARITESDLKDMLNKTKKLYGEKPAYKIKIENFEGPLDLLCHLIDKNKMDISI